MRRSTVDEQGVEMVELENGCVCCGPGASGLAPAVSDLAAREMFDHIVVELSGVADPTNVQNNLNGGGVTVDRKVTLVDANAFPALYNSVAEMGDRPDLAGADASEVGVCAVDRRVVELLLAQIESADVILVNKCDLASDDELRTTLAACRALNERAKICSTTFGNAQSIDLLPVTAATAANDGAMASDEPKSTESPHEHSHSHSHSHEHTHEHNHVDGAACDEPGCNDLSHSHDDQGHAGVEGCDDPLCNDPSHSHSHSYASVPNSAESLGFTSFVYRARRPFVQQRLVTLLGDAPVPALALDLSPPSLIRAQL